MTLEPPEKGRERNGERTQQTQWCEPDVAPAFSQLRAPRGGFNPHPHHHAPTPRCEKENRPSGNKAPGRSIKERITRVHQIIPITSMDEGVQAAMGRDLHEFLEVKEKYTQWMARHIEKYGFVAGQDFIRDFGKSSGGRPAENHIITLDMAKELSMLQSNLKGQQARRYFIEVEKQHRTNPIDTTQITRLEIAQMLVNAETERLALEAKNKELEPKADAYDSFIDATGHYSVGAVAKMLGKGQNWLFRELRNRGVLIAKGSMRNTPRQQYMHHFVVKAHEYERSNGEMGTSYTTYVQPSGIDFIRRKLELPTIDPIINV